MLLWFPKKSENVKIALIFLMQRLKNLQRGFIKIKNLNLVMKKKPPNEERHMLV